MTIVTIITNANDQTVYFEKPIERGFEYIRLVSCSLFNSWYNLKERGEIGFVDNSITTTKIIPPGNYSLSSIGKKMQELFEREYVAVKFDDARGPIVLENPYNKKIIFDRDLTFLFGLNENEEISRTQLKKQAVINRLASFNNYFIHCDLMDKEENLFNGKPSTILACFDVNGKSFERVEYSSKDITMKKITSGKYMSSIRITVTDENGELIDFNNLPLRFEIEFK